MGIQNIPSYNATSTNASALVKTGQGVCGGVVVSSSTAGTVKLWDNTAASGTVLVDTMSVSAGTSIRFDIAFATGLYVTIGGTATVSVLWV